MQADIFQEKNIQEVPQIPKKRMSAVDRIYVEEVFNIKTGDFGKNVLKPIINPQEDYLKKSQNSKLIGKKGVFTKMLLGKDLTVQYFVDLNQPNPEINIFYNSKHQTIELRMYELNYGTSFSLVCGMCSQSSKILYLISPGGYFYCQHCHKARYGSSYMKKEVPHQKYFRQINGLNKIMQNSPDIKRLYYNGDLTKRVKKRINGYKKAGLEVPDGLKKLTEIRDSIIKEKLTNSQKN